MGCIQTKFSSGRLNGKLQRWTSEQPMSRAELQRLRDQFWDTEPHYGGNRVIWDALKAAFSGDPNMRGIIIKSAGIIVGADDLSVLYDEKGVKYELPKYVLSDPQNLIEEKTTDSLQVDLSVHG